MDFRDVRPADPRRSGPPLGETNLTLFHCNGEPESGNAPENNLAPGYVRPGYPSAPSNHPGGPVRIAPDTEPAYRH